MQLSQACQAWESLQLSCETLWPRHDYPASNFVSQEQTAARLCLPLRMPLTQDMSSDVSFSV